MTRMAQNEMKAMRGMPLRVRSTEGLGVCRDSIPLRMLVLDKPVESPMALLHDFDVVSMAFGVAS